MGTLAVVPAPTVSVGGKRYSVRYAHGAIYLLSSWGIDMNRIFQTLAEALGRPADGENPAIEPNGRRVEIMTKIAAAGLGNIDGDGYWRSAGLTPQDLADRMTDEEAEAIDFVTWSAFSKKIGLPHKTEPAAPQPAIVPTIETDTPNNGGLTTGPSEPAPSA